MPKVPKNQARECLKFGVLAKKPAMAARAEELVKGTGWLPPPLRVENGHKVED